MTRREVERGAGGVRYHTISNKNATNGFLIPHPLDPLSIVMERGNTNIPHHLCCRCATSIVMARGKVYSSFIWSADALVCLLAFVCVASSDHSGYCKSAPFSSSSTVNICMRGYRMVRPLIIIVVS